MLYYHCSGSLQLIPPPENLSDSLQELIKLERSHEASLRAWNQNFWAANVAMNSWAISESSDYPILETLNQISKLLSKSVSAQNHFATALADYRACLKRTQDKEAELRSIKRDREILLKRFLKLNRRASVVPSNNLEFRIKLDDAKRELSFCQATLRAAADELHESKQHCFRQAFRAKLAKLEDLGHTIKSNAHQAVQLLDQMIVSDPPSEPESDFQSCDEDSIEEQALLTHPLLGHDRNPCPARSHPQRKELSKNFNIQSFRRTSVLGSQQDHLNDRSSKSNHPNGLHIHSGSRPPDLSPKPSVPGTGLLPPPRVLVRKRASIPLRHSHVRLQSRTKPFSSSFETRSYHSAIQSRFIRAHARQRSQSLDRLPAPIIIPPETSKPRKLIRPASSRVNSNPSIIKHLPCTVRPSRTEEQSGTFKLFPKSMISKLGAITKRKDEKTMSTKNQQDAGDDKTEDVRSLQAGQESSFWPTIQPLSLDSDTCSDDSFSDHEQRSEIFELEDETEGHEHLIRNTRTLRNGIQSSRGANPDSSPEPAPINTLRPQSIRRHSRPTSRRNIRKQTRMINHVQGSKIMPVNRKPRSTRPPEESSDLEDRSGQITISEGLNETIAEKSRFRNKEYEKTMEELTNNSLLSRIKEHEGLSISEIEVKQLGSPFNLQRRHLLISDKKSGNSTANEEHNDSKQEQGNLNQSSQQHQEITKQSNIENFHQHDPSNHYLQDTNCEFKHEIDNTHKAMGDIKAKFFSLGMHPSI